MSDLTLYEHLQRVSGAGYLLASSAIFATLPLIAAVISGGEAPFLFAAVWLWAAGVALLVYVRIFHREILTWAALAQWLPSRESFFRGLGQRGVRFNWLVSLSVTDSFNIVCQVWALAFLPEVATAVLFQFWTVVSIFALQLLYRNDSRYQPDFKTYLLCCVALGGAGLVVLSSADSDSIEASTGAEIAIGMVLVVAAIGLRCMGAVHFKWADVAVRSRPVSSSGLRSIPREASQPAFTQAAYNMAIAGVSRLIMGTLAFGVALLAGDSLSGNSVQLIVVCSAGVSVFGFLTDIVGVAKSARAPGTLAARYVTPVFSVAYLALASRASEVTVWMFVVGLGLIVWANVFIGLRQQPRNAKPLKPQP